MRPIALEYVLDSGDINELKKIIIKTVGLFEGEYELIFKDSSECEFIPKSASLRRITNDIPF